MRVRSLMMRKAGLRSENEAVYIDNFYPSTS